MSPLTKPLRSGDGGAANILPIAALALAAEQAQLSDHRLLYGMTQCTAQCRAPRMACRMVSSPGTVS